MRKALATIMAGIFAASLFFLTGPNPADAYWARYSTSQAISKYNKYISSYQKDEVPKIAKWRQNYQSINGSLADQLVERAIWYMDQGYMVYGHQYKGYKDYGIVDCSNFVSLVYSDLGFDITTTAKKYNTVGTRVNGVYAAKQGSYWTIKGTENLRPGDIFTYWKKDSSGNKYIGHVAIFMGMVDGKPLVIGTADTNNPTAIGIVDDVRYWWGSNFYTVRRVLPEGSWTPGQTIAGHTLKAPVIPKKYQLPPRKPVIQPLSPDRQIAPLSNVTPYTVRSGDTLWKIAQANGVTVTKIKSLNRLTTDWLYVGQKLLLPTPSYIVEPGDTLQRIATKIGVSLTDLRLANPTLINPNYLYVGQVLRLPKTTTVTLPTMPTAPATTPTTTIPTTTSPTPTTTTPATTTQQEYTRQVADLVNAERAKAGLAPLKLDSNLSNVAQVKAKDMIVNNYFSHTSPTYGSPFDMMKSFGINYSWAGENIAKGQTSPAQVMQDWMNSSGHKANILNANYNTIGVGYYQGAWVQMFIK
ncbi:LysM peptidoglycan-binding domain-containing protein [Heliophilum fasciatum]|uniref:Putative YkwD family protein n=1 Tax=Heliophilum fasciatum TaxID=35700 RepID=A0A4V2SWU2_9FIRM|nr:LysM peptidoglycan-binding domain-containing protein [Heliophilum fasciatum]MCW2278485.1 putative YkwD family protein [Heliophilum fasciatum]TCP63616.1 putative YkwD family protein [Heliophilum fasciatum]